ncbi:hypothetical protein CCUS01_00234 [Colletotrichum cuscutae]|uniref:Uncharacterized protein n=1 Tax=Colletotrichum cuscutae TaxID=1209917 RepID=A0AAI9YE77_9PEZI|nr:hypothetical protein CCUS01_00234 [Colletotrichum cuscutae]
MESVDKKSALFVPCFPPAKRHHHCIRDRGSHPPPHPLLCALSLAPNCSTD